MRSYLPYLVVGLASGSIYAIAAMGLVVTYKTSGMFNFGHGAIGMAATFVFYTLRVEQGVPTWLAALVAVGLVGPLLGALVDRLLLRSLHGAPASTLVVVALGLLVALQGGFLAVYGPGVRPMPPLLPQSSFRLPGVNVGWDQAILILLAAGIGLLLVAFFRSPLGVLTRAVVDDTALAQLATVNAQRITSLSWMIGGGLAALSGVLLSPLIGVNPVLLTMLVVQAFGAAAVGRLVSLPRTYLGALLIGVASSLATKLVVGRESLAGLPASIPFIVLFAVLVFSRKGKFVEVMRTEGRRRQTTSGGRMVRFPSGLLVVFATVALALPGRLDSADLLVATTVLVFVLIFASLGLLLGLSRQVSLCHVIFVLLGATTLAHLHDAGVPYLLALVITGMALAPIGAVVAVPAIRLSGLFLALATFGFGVLAQSLVFPTSLGFGSQGVLSIERPTVFGISLVPDDSYYVFVLVVVVLGLVAVETVRASRLGRILRAMADSPLALQSLGIDPVGPRVLVFCLSAMLAGVAGGLLGTLTSSISLNTFDTSQSLVWVTVLVTAGASTLGGAVIASLLLIWTPSVLTSSFFTDWQPVGFGVAAILLSQTPNGLAGLLRVPDFGRLADAGAWRLGGRRRPEPAQAG